MSNTFDSISPIYIIASERTGTNLLRRRFTEYQDVYFGPSPGHFLKNLYDHESYYGNLTVDKNFFNLIADALGLCYIHFSPWEIQLTKEDVLNEYSIHFQKRDTVLLAHYLMTKYAIYKGFKSYICKDNHLWEFVHPILKNLPNAKFIYLCRDPRDYAISQLRRKATSDSIYTIATLWKIEQEKSIQVFNELKEKAIKISYENIIQNERQEMEKIGQFVGIKTFDKRREIKNFDTGSTDEWKNLEKETIQDNYNKYLRNLSQKKIDVAENICWESMNHLGYHPTNKERPKITVFYRYIDPFWGQVKRIIRFLASMLTSKDTRAIKINMLSK